MSETHNLHGRNEKHTQNFGMKTTKQDTAWETPSYTEIKYWNRS